MNSEKPVLKTPRSKHHGFSDPMRALGRADLSDPSLMFSVLVALIGPRASDPCTLLRWFGCARRAMRVGRKPGALFRSLWSGKRWAWISQADEDGARADTALVLHGRGPRKRARDPVAEAKGEYDD